MEDAVNAALRRLMQLGLLDAEQRLHRLLGEFIGVDTTAQTAVEEGLTKLAYQLNVSGFPAALRSLLPHMTHTTEVAVYRADVHAANPAVNLASHFQIVETALGSDHPTTKIVFNNLESLRSMLQ